METNMTDDNTEKAHNQGAEFVRESTSPNTGPSPLDRIMEIADSAVEDMSTLTGKVIKDEPTSKLTAGAAIGAAAALLVPFVSIPVGAVAGLGYVLYRNAQKNK
jgi:hypothetical protein